MNDVLYFESWLFESGLSLSNEEFGEYMKGLCRFVYSGLHTECKSKAAQAVLDTVIGVLQLQYHYEFSEENNEENEN